MMKKHAVLDIFGRELGNLSTRKFAHHFAASEDLVMRLERARTLEKHRGIVSTRTIDPRYPILQESSCGIGVVSTLSFNADGDILVAGDDRAVTLWDWETGNRKLSFNSDHHNEVLEAKIMPESYDRSIVTCGVDGQVRHATILECGNVETKYLGIHDGSAHKIANVPENPHIFYTCGEDGLVQHFDLRTREPTKLFTCQPTYALSHELLVNLHAIVIDPRDPNLLVVGGSDTLARLYDIRSYKHNASAPFGKPADHFCPKHLLFSRSKVITGLAYSDQSELLVSYSKESIYRFSKDMGWGSNETQTLYHLHLVLDSGVEMVTESKQGPLLFKGHKNNATIKGVGFFGPNCEYVVSGSDCGQIYIWRNKDGKLVRVIEGDKQLGSCIEAHPRIPILASSFDRYIKIWTPTALERATRKKLSRRRRRG